MTGDGWDWVREEQRAARDAQGHLEHPADCTCGCRFTPEAPERRAA